MVEPARVSAEDAQRMYADAGYGDWYEDSRWGLVLALDRLLERTMVQRLHRATKRHQGKRQRKDEPVRRWVTAAYRDFRPTFAAMQREGIPPATAFGQVMGHELGRAIVEEVLERNSIELLWSVPEAVRAPLVEAATARLPHYRPRAEYELQAFYHGTLFWQHARSRPQPTSKPMALLAAATELEPMDEGLTAHRKRWDTRLNAWRRKLESETPNWRTAVGVRKGAYRRDCGPPSRLGLSASSRSDVRE